MIVFPEFTSALNYSQKQSIVNAFPHLKDLNDWHGWRQQNIIGIIIKSNNADNIHKAIKYQLWTTINKNKQILNQAYRRHQQQGREVYLFFTVTNQYMFTGVARLASGYNPLTFPFWWADYFLNFQGCFYLEWIYIKDIDFEDFRGLKGFSINCNDCELITENTSKSILDIYSRQKTGTPWIFDDFRELDKRECIYCRKFCCLTSVKDKYRNSKSSQYFQNSQQSEYYHNLQMPLYGQVYLPSMNQDLQPPKINQDLQPPENGSHNQNSSNE